MEKLRSVLLAHPALPILLFACVVVAFVAVNASERVELAPADRDAERIAREAAPGIELLSSIRTEARTLRLLVGAYLAAPTDARRREVDTALAALRERLNAYYALAALPGEIDGTATLHATELSLRSATEDATSGSSLGPVAADRRVAAATLQLTEAATKQLAAKAELSARLANRISSIHRDVEHVSYALDASCLALASIFGVLAYRLRMRNDALLSARAVSAEQRASELDLFGARVAHDIRGPLQAAKTAVDFLRRRPRDPATTAAMLERAGRSVDRVLTLTDDLLDFARAGAAPTPGAVADVKEVVLGVVAELEPAAEAAGVTITVEPFGPARAACSPGAFTSVLSNLVRNAIKYIGDTTERRVVIRVHDGAHAVRTEVSDTGPGLAPDLGDAAFDLYARGRTSQPGYGLGLATAKRLIEAHHGTIGHRAREGGGTTFWFDLPIPPATAAGGAPRSTEPARSGAA